MSVALWRAHGAILGDSGNPPDWDPTENRGKDALQGGCLAIPIGHLEARDAVGDSGVFRQCIDLIETALTIARPLGSMEKSSLVRESFASVVTPGNPRRLHKDGSGKPLTTRSISLAPELELSQ